MTPREEVLWQLEIEVIERPALDYVGHECDTKVRQCWLHPEVLTARVASTHGRNVATLSA